ncbi:MAG: helix-turn-helix domain-containing protein [Solirubrobacteraceae bacterium]
MADIGATLREARMRARIDINEVESSTKIRAKYLRAIENEEWGLLPGDVYVKSFLRTYGDYLGLDSRQLIDEYKRRYERPTDHELRPLAPLGRERERRGGRRRRGGGGGPLVPPWALIGAVVVAIVVVLVLIGNPNKGSGGSSTTQSSTSRQAASGHRARHHRHRTATGAGGSGLAGTKPAATRVKLQLVPTGAVYVCLVDGSGKTLIPGVIYDVGQRIPTKTSTKLLLTLGNASVKMKVNGVSVHVPSTGQPVGYELTPGSQTPLPAGKQPQCT